MIKDSWTEAQCDRTLEIAVCTVREFCYGEYGISVCWIVFGGQLVTLSRWNYDVEEASEKDGKNADCQVHIRVCRSKNWLCNSQE